MNYPYPYPDDLPLPNCPECNNKMIKQGGVWSGRKKVQNFRCNHCGRNTIVIDPTIIKTGER